MIGNKITNFKKRLSGAVNRPGSDINPADMEWLGIGNIMRAAKWANYFKYGHIQRARKRLYRDAHDSMLAQHGAPMMARGLMEDGFLLDSTCRWPHLESLIAQCEDIIAERGLTRRGVPGREWIRDIFQWPDLEKHPAVLDFILSPDVVSVVSRYLGFIPSLSNTVPPGVRLTESFQDEISPEQMPYRQSQLFHLDIHDTPMVYVVVLLRDVTEKSGPFCFLSASASDRVTKALGYRKRGKPYRLSDEEVYRIVDRNEVQVMTGKAGTVLFLDPSRCFHYGSRDAVVPRYQAMYAYVSPCRADFTQWLMPARVFPRNATETLVRRLVLDSSAQSFMPHP
jgi:hypothetical protein